MSYDGWKLATPSEYDDDREPLCSDCDDTGCPECRGDREDDDTPECNCGTCIAPDFTCIRED
jgi:hypothetical protein